MGSLVVECVAVMMSPWKCTAKFLGMVGLLGLAACNTETTTDMSNEEKLARIEEMTAGFRPQFAEVPEVDAATLREDLARGTVVLVDVRSEKERATSMIPGAITSDEFQRRADELAGSSVVTYCTIGYRSSTYAQQLLQDGWDVRNFHGSVLAWTHAGGELVDSEGQPTKRVHVFAERWSLTADDYEPVW